MVSFENTLMLEFYRDLDATETFVAYRERERVTETKKSVQAGKK